MQKSLAMLAAVVSLGAVGFIANQQFGGLPGTGADQQLAGDTTSPFVLNVSTDNNAFAPSSFMTYSFNVANNSSSPQTSLIFYYARPSGMIFVQGGSTNCSQVGNGDIIKCQVNDIAAHGSQGWSMRMQLFAGAACNGNAQINSNFKIVQNNVTTVATAQKITPIVCTMPSALTLNVSNSPTTYAPGSIVTYSFNVVNSVPNVQSNLKLVFNRPSGMIFLPAGSPQGCAAQGDMVSCPITDIQGKGSQGFSMRMQLFSGAKCDGSNQISTTFKVQQNNVTMAQMVNSIPVLCAQPAGLSYTVSASPNTLSPGKTTTFTIALKNNIPNVQEHLTLVYQRPAGMILVPASSYAGCAVLGDNIVCPIPTIQGNGNTSINVTMQLFAGASCASNASISHTFKIRQNEITVALNPPVIVPVSCSSSSRSSSSSSLWHDYFCNGRAQSTPCSSSDDLTSASSSSRVASTPSLCTPPSCPNPPANCHYANATIQNGCPINCGQMLCTSGNDTAAGGGGGGR